MIRPDGDSVYASPLELSPGYCTLSILFSDWSRSGDRDLRMTNDRHYYVDGQEQLWNVEPGALPIPYQTDSGWQDMQIWGMGIASHDVTGDGRPEFFLTSQGDNKLQTLAAGSDQPNYTDIALGSGATAHRPFQGDTERPSTAWHAEFGDVNNYSFIDLFVTKGNVEAMEGFAVQDPNNLLLGSPRGTFAEGAAEAGIIDFSRSRGGALADLNLDGLLDIIVVERTEPAKIWRNISGMENANWLMLDVDRAGPNRDGIGAWLELRVGDRTLSHEIVVGGGHASGELGWIHFGLGASDRAQLRVTWPEGDASPWTDVEANSFVVVDRTSITDWAPVPD